MTRSKKEPQLKIALLLSGGTFRLNCPRTGPNDASCSGLNASVDAQQRASITHKLILDHPRFAKVDVFIDTTHTRFDSLLASWYAPRVVAFRTYNVTSNIVNMSTSVFAENTSDDTSFLMQGDTAGDTTTEFSLGEPAVGAGVEVTSAEVTSAEASPSASGGATSGRRRRHCSSRALQFGGRESWHLGWASTIRRPGAYDGLIVMRPDMVLKPDFHDLITTTRLLGGSVSFLFRTMGCPTLGEFGKHRELAGFTPNGNPRVFDGFLWVPSHVLRDRELRDESFDGWFACHDAIDVMPPKLPVEFFLPSTHGANVERGWNPLFTIAGRRSFPLGAHPMCCTLVNAKTKKIFGVDCWKREHS